MVTLRKMCQYNIWKALKRIKSFENILHLKDVYQVCLSIHPTEHTLSISSCETVFCEGVDVVLSLVILFKKLRTNAASYSLSLLWLSTYFSSFSSFFTNGIPFSHYLHRSLSHLYFNLIILILSFHTYISKGTTLEAMTWVVFHIISDFVDLLALSRYIMHINGY